MGEKYDDKAYEMNVARNALVPPGTIVEAVLNI